MNPAETLRHLIQMANQPAGIAWAKLTPIQRQQIPTAMRQQLVLEHGGTYHATPAGARFISPPEPQPLLGKTCPACRQDLPASAYWRDPNRSDGLFYYCSECESNRRKEKRAMRREALKNLKAAGDMALDAARLWDEGTEKLAQAWTLMMTADGTVRQARAAGVTDCDWGNLDLRLMHQAGTYALGKRLLAARYPWQGSFLHNDAQPDTLSAWMGDNPAEPYLGSKLEEDANGSPEGIHAPERREGPEEGVPNKATQTVREAIALVAEQNVGAVHRWLAEIDDPAKRLDLYLRLLEYHVPKLARTEVSGADGQPLQIRVVKFGDSDSQ